MWTNSSCTHQITSVPKCVAQRLRGSSCSSVWKPEFGTKRESETLNWWHVLFLSLFVCSSGEDPVPAGADPWPEEDGGRRPEEVCSEEASPPRRREWPSPAPAAVTFCLLSDFEWCQCVWYHVELWADGWTEPVVSKVGLWDVEENVARCLPKKKYVFKII